MQSLPELINQLESKIPHFEKLNPSVSAASAGWHIQHTLLAAFTIIEVIKKSNPNEYKWKFNLQRMFVFTMNSIPRGKGRAPKAVIPTDTITAAGLIRDVQVLKEKINELNNLHPDQFFKHPYFDELNLKATIKMLKIHTRHHIKIIDDIIGAG